MKIFVGNLAQHIDQPRIREKFESFGTVARVTLAIGKADGARKGFGFVEMPSVEQGNAAINALDGAMFAGNPLQVREARPGTYKADPFQERLPDNG